MKCYTNEDLLKNKYAVVCWDDEDDMNYLISLHKEKQPAQKRIKHLNTPFAYDNHQVYYIMETSDDRIKWDEEDKEIYIVRR